MNAPSLVETVASAFADAGVDLAAWGLGWARVAPTILLVPAFGLRALPAPVRGVLGLMLALAILPAMGDAVHARDDVPWALLALENVLIGVPTAIAAAVPLWAATMAGGLVDSLRGSQDSFAFVTVEGRASPLGVPFAMLASYLFLQLGGPARVVLALAQPDPALHARPLLALTHHLVNGIGLAVSLAGPLLAAAVVLELAGALVARAASPAQVHALIAPLRTLAVLAMLALAFDRIALVLAAHVRPH